MPYYRGDVDKVEVFDRTGTRLWINCRHFRRFLTPSGIHGRFRLLLDEKGNVESLDLI